MPSLLQNVRLGVRSLRHAPGFTTTAVLTLALGIGLSTAVFTVADALLLRRLAVHDQDRLVVLTGQMPDRGIDSYPLGLQSARDFARDARTLSAVAFFGYEGATPEPVRDAGELSRLHRALVSGDFFAVLGARPLLGRTLRPEDDVRGAAPVVVLSHRAWQERFGGARDVLGRRITLHENDVAYTVVGVMPQGLDHPRGTDMWAAMMPAIPEQNEPYIALNLIARLAPGASPATAR